MYEILSHLDSKYSAKINATETYYEPNYWKFYWDFAELIRFDIAALYGSRKSILPWTLFRYIPLQHG